ncbi:uracil-DNA glycosylase [Cupriavidus basilensis]|uniref:Uracil-DNA glycosylase n=1 Tax=Cupriavidus basilensis TaxID=68895 RepID=A0A643FMP1_9BURK|nr:uracil-DNA glycosylase [Cupriavidus basilensis]QOT82075.1 uracil-DNA glycosylase [Cupriavidus basilensis]
MRLHPFVESVAKLQFENCFNPYTDRCEVHDRWDAPRRRSSVLSAMLHRAAEEPIDAIWIGRDLGYRGGRRTGLALTDDVHMVAHARRWGVQVGAERPTKGAAIAERTAAVIWSQLDQIDARIFLWNVFPLHPHEPGDCFSNRQHNARERCAGEELLQQLVGDLRPARIVAIGNDAAATAHRIANTTPVYCVRHPSYGGQTEFKAQVASLYKLSGCDSLF